MIGKDEIISASDIYTQDIICTEVAKDPKRDDFVIYNNLTGKIDVYSLDRAVQILELIKKNKLALFGIL